MSATRVIKALTNNGYKKIKGSTDFSSIVEGGVRHIWSNGTTEVHLGLNVKGFPPSLVYPRPAAAPVKVDEGFLYVNKYIYDGEIIDFINGLTEEEIINGIETDWKGITFELSEASIKEINDRRKRN